MDCPICGSNCYLITIGTDPFFGEINIWSCTSCDWEEGEEDENN